MFNSGATRGLPNQVKALVALSTLGGDAKGTVPIDMRHFEPHDDLTGWLYMNFLNIMQVQVLTGYRNNDVTQPMFSTLSEKTMPPKPALCRLTRFLLRNGNLVPCVNDKTPVFNEYFVLEPQKKKKQSETKIPTTQSPKSVETAKGAVGQPTAIVGTVMDSMYITTGLDYTLFVPAGPKVVTLPYTTPTAPLTGQVKVAGGPVIAASTLASGPGFGSAPPGGGGMTGGGGY